ncbi:isocitrate lyase/PEP mutase family protein [Eionea flava]
MINHPYNFTELHQQEDILLLPNTWDTLSAVILEQAGFKAIGTTSWGMANAKGYTDGENIRFQDVFCSVNEMVNTVKIPVGVDIESGFSTHVRGIVDNVLQLADIGVAGINIEDSLKGVSKLRDVKEHCQNLEKIRHALDMRGYSQFFINARTDTYLQQGGSKTDTIARAKAYVNSGVNGIFVPGISDEDDIRQLVQTVNIPVNVMSLPSLTDVSRLHSLGVKRFSLGNSLSDAAIAYIEKQANALRSTLSSSHLYLATPPVTQFITQ